MGRISRNTKQKELIKKELERFGSFFTAEDLYEKVNRKEPSIGIATIYRYLKEAKDSHELYSYLCDRKTIYSLGKKSHCHFICEKCGRIKHFDIDNLDSIKHNIKGSICHFQIDVNGICEKCKNNKS